jgi:hypothetical protein
LSGVGGEAAKPPLALERYATLNAELEAGELLNTILEREAIAKETWLSAQAFWLARMAEEATGKRFETTTRYQALFNAKRKVFEARFERARKKRDREPPKPNPIEIFDGATAELARAPFTQLPNLSFPEPPQAAPITARDPQLDLRHDHQHEPSPVTARDARPPAQAATPFFSAPAYVQQPPPAPTAPRKNATVSFDLPAVVKPATPFSEAKAAAPAAPPAAAPAAPAAKRDFGATWMGEVPTVDVPFRKEAGAEARPLAAPQAKAERPPANVPAPAPLPATAVRANETAPIPDAMQRQLREKFLAEKKPNLGATMMADATFLQSAPATPFKQSPAAPPAAPAPKPSSPATPDDDDDDSPRTKMVDPDLVARLSAQATPFGARPPAAAATAAPPLPSPGAATAPLPPGAATAHGDGPPSTGPKKFSINVFASLTAEIAENPSDVEAIRQRYGVSDSEHRAESGRWTAEFAQNAELRQRYLGIVQRYRGYIQQRKGG